MRKIVKEILEAESRVGAILQQARERASEMRRSAESEISEETGAARQQARGIVQAAVAEAGRESEQIREEALRRADRQAEALRNGRTDVIEDLVTRICKVILSTECEMDDS